MKTWYAAAVKTGRENSAEDNLKNQGFECYLPRIRKVSTVKRKRKDVVKVNGYTPLFPGYIFVRFDPEIESTATVNSTIGIKRLITFGNKLIGISAAFMDYLIEYTSINQEKGTQQNKTYQKGDEIEITEGPFSGMKAVFEEPCGEKRSLVLFKLFHQRKIVTLDNTSFK